MIRTDPVSSSQSSSKYGRSKIKTLTAGDWVLPVGWRGGGVHGGRSYQHATNNKPCTPSLQYMCPDAEGMYKTGFWRSLQEVLGHDFYVLRGPILVSYDSRAPLGSYGIQPHMQPLTRFPAPEVLASYSLHRKPLPQNGSLDPTPKGSK